MQSVHLEVLIRIVGIFSMFAATCLKYDPGGLTMSMSVHFSACNSSRTVEQIFLEFCIEGVLIIFVDTYQFWLESDSHNGHFTWKRTGVVAHILSITWQIFTRAKIHPNLSCREKLGTHFMARGLFP
jgi:hypothetical protein